MKKFMDIISKGFNKAVDILYPENLKCIICDNDMPASTDDMICDKCLKNISVIANPCEICGEEIISDDKICVRCSHENRMFKIARAPYVYDGELKKIIYNLKYNEDKWLAKFLAPAMAKTFVDNKMKADFLVPTPMFIKKFKKRGYNQAELLANKVSKILNLPVCNSVIKFKDTETQTKLTAEERNNNIYNAFVVDDKFVTEMKTKKVCIIDDVYTTGATVRAVARAICEIGGSIENISVLTFAHTSSPVQEEKFMNLDLLAEPTKEEIESMEKIKDGDEKEAAEKQKEKKVR